MPLRVAARGGLALMLLAAPAAWGAGEDPLQLMRDLEARVLAARQVIIEADIRVSGALAAHLNGRAEFSERNRARAEYRGDLQGQPIELGFSSDGRAVQIKGASAQRAEDIGAESNHAWLVGALRLGLWHNLSRLNEAQGPDHATRSIEPWASLEAFRPTTYALGGEMQGSMSFGFDLLLDGRNAGSARVWLDPVSGLPRRRQSLLHLPQGETTVIEDYRRFTLD